MNRYLEKIAGNIGQVEDLNMNNRYLEKIAGNRLIRHIAENRENFPMSRLLEMAEKGLIKSPEQLLPGRNLGVKNQFNATAQKYGLNTSERPVSLLFPSLNVAVADRTVAVNGKYYSKMGMTEDKSKVFVENKVPPLYDPVPGNHVENIKRISDTHANNHETFEADEGLRKFRRGMLADGTETHGHHNPAVLLRESRDMSSNPYAHIVPPQPNKDEYFKFVERTRQQGKNLAEEIQKSRILSVDPSADLPLYRARSGEADFISHLQRGKPYQSNPTSSEIRRARRMPTANSEAFFDSRPKAGFFKRTLDDIREVYDSRKGNSAFRN